MKRKLVGFVVACAITALPGVAAANCEIKLGATGPLSGAATQWGLAIKGAADYVAAEVNAKGGMKVGDETCQLRVIAIDAKYTAEGAAAAANNFVSQGVKFILGPMGSPEVTGMKPIATRNKMLMMSDSYARDAIGPRWPLTFHMGPGPAAWGDPIVKHAKEKFGVKKALTIAPNDQAGTDVAEVVAGIYEKNGVPTKLEYYQRGTTNFAPIVTRIMANAPDVVDTVSTPPGDAGILVKQLRQAGYQGVIGRLGGPGTAEIARVAGGMDVLRDFYWFEPVFIDENVLELQKSYKKLLNAEPPENNFFYLFVAGGRALVQAIEKAGTYEDAVKVAEALRTIDVIDPNLGEGKWIGQATYKINQELSLPFGIGTIRDGKEQPVIRVDAPVDY
ncbi:ABC transporter substrate-binding protein [Pollutimonas bauzanensis]|uniref:Amino acid/amide ABC transporter substrate-binding protein, HAAT family (TC 3.A.1.4.-) n=1 Tax=Pollutimonas bauzanensis TaxID=658167 RepID=A0A1M5ML09_9BURK|nr:ABC transporter substrate-binding protein [Pollutimonas bauzanensis]SHG77453.1 amino acid/amide ABC transporter substrate-binding protein, HAAT family (TC 3.A.1.4.-) [Pollutimonas bauzanensis]